MQENFDVKSLARSIAKLMEMADLSISKPGAGIATERLIDYCSDEFQRVTMEQSLRVLAEIDKDYEKKLLKDGHGEIIGYVYSRKIFISMRHTETRFGGNKPPKSPAVAQAKNAVVQKAAKAAKSTKAAKLPKGGKAPKAAKESKVAKAKTTKAPKATREPRTPKTAKVDKA